MAAIDCAAVHDHQYAIASLQHIENENICCNSIAEESFLPSPQDSSTMGSARIDSKNESLEKFPGCSELTVDNVERSEQSNGGVKQPLLPFQGENSKVDIMANFDTYTNVTSTFYNKTVTNNGTREFNHQTVVSPCIVIETALKKNRKAILPPPCNQETQMQTTNIEKEHKADAAGEILNTSAVQNQKTENGKLLKRSGPLLNHNKCFECDVCGEKFTVRRWLEKHMLRHYDRKYSCDICGKKYVTKADAVVHKRRHTLERKFICDLCGKKFVYLSELNAHLKKHLGLKLPRNIICATCGKAFMTQRDLNRHATVHTGEQPFECPLCGKKFSQEVNMQVHIKIHTNVKPHKCELCEKSFITRSKLSRHQTSHSSTGSFLNKPFRCVLCPRSYSSENSLVRHLRGHRRSAQTVTHALSKAIEKSETQPTYKAGALLATLIDQAVSAAKSTSKEPNKKKSDLSQIIDGAIYHSKVTSHSTQTPLNRLQIDQKRTPTEKDSSHQSGSSPECTASDKTTGSNNIPCTQGTKGVIQTIIVRPKGKVLNFGPTSQQKLSQRPSQTKQRKIPYQSLQYLPINVHHNGDKISLSHDKGPKVFILHPSSSQSVQPLIITPRKCAPAKKDVNTHCDSIIGMSLLDEKNNLLFPSTISPCARPGTLGRHSKTISLATSTYPTTTVPFSTRSSSLPVSGLYLTHTHHHHFDHQRGQNLNLLQRNQTVQNLEVSQPQLFLSPSTLLKTCPNSLPPDHHIYTASRPQTCLLSVHSSQDNHILNSSVEVPLLLNNTNLIQSTACMPNQEGCLSMDQVSLQNKPDNLVAFSSHYRRPGASSFESVPLSNPALDMNSEFITISSTQDLDDLPKNEEELEAFELPLQF